MEANTQEQELIEAQKAAAELEKKQQEFNDALELRAKELSVKNKDAKVVPIWYVDPVDGENGKPIIGFLKEPNRMTKASLADEITKSMHRGYNMALTACLMKEESDPRLLSNDQKYDAVIMAASYAAGDFIAIAINQYKKK
jgi:deoxyxylulose-5-phosphate synthase